MTVRAVRAIVAVGAVIAVAVAAGRGEGRAIFNVDVFSFLQGGGKDTLPYTLLGGVSGNVDNPPIEVSLLGGLGNSTVETVTLTVGADLDNTTGSGTVSFQIFFATDSASTYTGTPLLNASGPLAPGTITPITGSATFADSLFNRQSLWVGIRLAVTTNPGPAVNGTMRLSALDLRIVLRDRF